MVEQVCVVLIRNSGVEELFICDSSENAEKKFLDLCSINISNWAEYTGDDIAAVLDNGYEEFGHHNSVCLVHPTTED